VDKTFDFDRHHFASKKFIPELDARTENQHKHYQFDRHRNQITCYNHNVSISCRYDHADRKVAETADFGDFRLTLAWTHYPDGRIKSLTRPDATTTEYKYDGSGNPTEIITPYGTIRYCDYREDRPAGVILPGGTETRFRYDRLLRITSITTTGPGGSVIQNISYNYDRHGNIIRKGTVGGDYAYEYDALSRLARVRLNGEVIEAYSYDDAGNRLTSHIANNWTYGGNNRLLGYGNTGYMYDEPGNTVRVKREGRIQNYVYDSENRLIQVNDSGNGPLVKYSYDPFGRRIRKEVFRNPLLKEESRGEGTVTYFLYSDEGLVGEYDARGKEVRAYGYRPHASWTTDPVYMVRDGRCCYFLNDHLGAPQVVIDENGKALWSARYEAYGTAHVNSDSTITSNLRFPGQYYDAETGLHYNCHRYYDPRTGRYITPDPLGPAGGDHNLYRYVSNNPVNKSDRYGLFHDDFDDYRDKRNRRWKNQFCRGPKSRYADTRGLYIEHTYVRPPGINDQVEHSREDVHRKWKFKGHGDMHGSQHFDWVKQDYGKHRPFMNTSTDSIWWFRFSIMDHFKTKEQCIKAINDAIITRDKDAFERAMHEFQDTFCHRDAKPWWDPWGPLWHLLSGSGPDEDMIKWEEANEETKKIIDKRVKTEKLTEQEQLECGYDNLYDKWINEVSKPHNQDELGDPTLKEAIKILQDEAEKKESDPHKP
jgi:RHS repeat-associated protein